MTEPTDQQTDTFDFSSAEAKTRDKATLTIRHPTRGELPVKVTVAGRDSMLYQTEAAKYRKDLVKAARNGEGQELTDEDGRHILAEFLSSIILDWKGVAWEGDPMEPTKANKYKLLSDPAYRWFRDQVDDFATDRRNFLGN